VPQGEQIAEPIEHQQVLLLLEQPLVGMLAGDAGQMGGDLPQGLHGGHAAVDIDAMAVVAGDDAAYEQPLRRIVAQIGHHAGHAAVRRHIEQRLQFGALGAGADQRGRSPAAQ
jgi:hypothetical protein